jgi:5'-methylthioadenosine phosphorylase
VTAASAVKVGILTGSGTYELPGWTDGRADEVETPFGAAHVNSGAFAGHDVLHVSRHQPKHRLLSHQVNHRANVWALRELGASCVLGVTVCGVLDGELPLGSIIVFDDLHFLANRLPDGSACTLHTEPGRPGRGHWIFDLPFSDPLREALLAGARETGQVVRDGGCYGHVDGPRFNTRTEIGGLRDQGVTAVSQTAGPETVLCGEACLPYALAGFATDYANGIASEPTSVADLATLLQASAGALSSTLAAAVPRAASAGALPVGTHYRFD